MNTYENYAVAPALNVIPKSCWNQPQDIVELLDRQEHKNDQQDADQACRSLILREVR